MRTKQVDYHRCECLTGSSRSRAGVIAHRNVSVVIRSLDVDGRNYVERIKTADFVVSQYNRSFAATTDDVRVNLVSMGRVCTEI